MYTKEGVKGIKGTFQKWDSVREVTIQGKKATRCYLLITEDTPRWMSASLGPKLPSDIGRYLVVDFFSDHTIDVIVSPTEFKTSP